MGVTVQTAYSDRRRTAFNGNLHSLNSQVTVKWDLHEAGMQSNYRTWIHLSF